MVDEPNKVDQVSVTSDGAYVLTIQDHWDWEVDFDHVQVLEDKLNAYLGFIDLPKLMEPNTDLAGVVQTLPTIGGWTILVLLVLHVGGAIYHQAIRRDGTLLRMI